MSKTISRRGFLRLDWLWSDQRDDSSDADDESPKNESLDRHLTDDSPTNRRETPWGDQRDRDIG
jgi:hypothetical protein